MLLFFGIWIQCFTWVWPSKEKRATVYVHFYAFRITQFVELSAPSHAHASFEAKLLMDGHTAIAGTIQIIPERICSSANSGSFRFWVISKSLFSFFPLSRWSMLLISLFIEEKADYNFSLLSMFDSLLTKYSAQIRINFVLSPLHQVH